MTTQTVGTCRPASLPGGITGYAGQPVTWSSSRTSMTRRSQQDPGVSVRQERLKMHFPGVPARPEMVAR
jgi:hypothetical protein